MFPTDSEMSDNISEAESNYPEEEASIQKQHADNSIENRSQNGEIKSRWEIKLDLFPFIFFLTHCLKK